LGTVNITRQPAYTDLDLMFDRNRKTGDVAILTGAQAINRSIRNLVLTNFYERPFRPWMGSNVKKLLFDNMNDLTTAFLQDAITEVVNNYEPRVILIDVLINPDVDRNTYSVSLLTMVKNTMTPLQVDLYLRRIR
jgi:uncharacterized protein